MRVLEEQMRKAIVWSQEDASERVNEWMSTEEGGWQESFRRLRSEKGGGAAAGAHEKDAVLQIKFFFFFFTVTRPTLNKIFVCLSLAVGNKKKMSMSIHTPVCLEALFIIAKPKLKTYPVNSPCPHLTQQFSQTSKEDIFRADSKAKTQFKCLKKNKKKKQKQLIQRLRCSLLGGPADLEPVSGGMG